MTRLCVAGGEDDEFHMSLQGLMILLPCVDHLMVMGSFLTSIKLGLEVGNLTVVDIQGTRLRSVTKAFVQSIPRCRYLTIYNNMVSYVTPHVLRIPDLVTLDLTVDRYAPFPSDLRQRALVGTHDWNYLKNAVEFHFDPACCINAVVAYLVCHLKRLPRNVAHQKDVVQYLIAPMLLSTLEDDVWYQNRVPARPRHLIC